VRSMCREPDRNHSLGTRTGDNVRSNAIRMPVDHKKELVHHTVRYKIICLHETAIQRKNYPSQTRAFTSLMNKLTSPSEQAMAVDKGQEIFC
jgi:hypothetical protein